jgi:protein required for attachment to host cells
MNRIWVLVANQAEAQFYTCKRLPGKLEPAGTLTNEEGAAHARDLISDAPGRVHDRTGNARHMMEPDTAVKVEIRRRFVKEMVGRLESAHRRHDFDELVIMAAPAVLGVIRKTMTAALSKAVVRELPKDVIGQGLDKIEAQLQREFELV